MKKIAKLGVLMIPFINNFIILDFYIYPKIYNDSGYGMVFYFIVGLVLTCLLSTIVRNYSFNPIRIIRKNKIVKSFFLFYLIIMIILGLSFSSVALTSIFYLYETPFKFVIMLLVISLFMLNIKITTLVNVSAILALVGIPLIFYNTISHLYMIDFNSISYISSNLEIVDVGLICFIILDTFMYSLIIPYFQERTKQGLTIGTIFYFIFEGVEALILVLMLGTSLKEYYGFGYFLYSIEPVTGIIGNFDFVYIFMISFSAIFKLSFSINVIKLFYYEKKKIVFSLVYPIITITSYFICKYFYLVDDYIYYILLGIAFFLVSILIYLRRVDHGYSEANSIS